MRKLSSAFILQIFLILLIALMLFFARNLRMANTDFSKVSYISDVQVSVDGKEAENISLPYSFKKLAPQTPVTVTATIYPEKDDMLYIKTVYSPAKVYVNNQLLYEFGQRASYPFFMKDPATEAYMINPEVFGSRAQLRIEYLSPVSDNSLTIHTPIMGTFKAIFANLVMAYRTPFILSIIQLALGVFLIVISVMVMFFEKKISKIVAQLGAFSLTSGLWAFGECNLTETIIKNPALLYLFAFIGLFTLVIPLLHFGISAINFKNPKPVYYLSIFMTVLNIIAALLQFSGLVPFYQSKYIFHILTPLALCYLTGAAIYESIHYKNKQARRFVIPISILTASGIIEVVNYQIRITTKFAYLFQNGIVLFILVMGITTGLYIRDVINIQKENELLEFEMKLMEVQIIEQRKYHTLIAQNEAALKKQRHDLRHHLIVIKELAENEYDKLYQYLDTLIANIPSGSKQYCQNKAVNSIISHYAAICAKTEIKFTANTPIPESNDIGFDNDLCIIFGNLLENAVEACERMKDGNKYLLINSRIKNDTLIIMMENSFDGNFATANEKIYSSKRDDFGIGLSSIRSVAQKHQGDTTFEAKKTIFTSLVYLKLNQ